MAINYNEEEFGLQLPNNNQGIMQVADLYDTPDGALPYSGPEQYNYYKEGMLNTPDNRETLNFTKAVNEYGYPLMASSKFLMDQAIADANNIGSIDMSAYYTPEMQETIFGNPNYFENNQTNNLPFTSMADMAAANKNFMDQFRTGKDFQMVGPLRGTNVMEGSVIPPDMNIRDYQYPMGTDIYNMDEMNTYGNTIAEELIDENRIPGRIQESVPNYQSGWDKFTGKIGDVWSGAKNKLSNFKMPPIGIMGLIQAMNRNPFDIDSPNYSKGLGLQVDDLRQVGFLPQKTADGYKILGGPLAGKNLVSAFGTNDYDEMLAKKAAWFQRRKDLGKGFSQKNWDKLKKEQEARAAEMRAHGQRGVGERTLGGNFQIERGGSDAVNRDLARREAANRNRSRAARQDTTSMRSAGRSYTDAQGNRGYSRGRRDGGRIGYANGGLASLFTRRG